MIRRILFIICLSFCTMSFAQRGVDLWDDKGKNDTPIVSSMSISIFPNPAVHYFQVTDNDDILELVVTDLLGKKVKTFHYASGSQYDIHDLQKGMYLIQIISKDKDVLKIQRLIKNQP